MKRELRFERRLNSTVLIRQIQTLKKDVTMLKKRQEQIIKSLEGPELTEKTKKALKEVRFTPIEKYVSHEDAKR